MSRVLSPPALRLSGLHLRLSPRNGISQGHTMPLRRWPKGPPVSLGRGSQALGSCSLPAPPRPGRPLG